MIARYGVLAVLAGAVLVADPVVAQAPEAVRAIVQEVQTVIAAERWGEAERRLNEGSALCRQGDPGLSCRLLLDFNQAYLQEQQGRAEPERRESLLDQSAATYTNVLLNAPGHPATTRNLALVLRDLGRGAELDALFEKTAVTNSKLASDVSTALGDVHRDAGRWRAAYDAYSRAATLDYQDDIPRRGMVDAYVRLPPEQDEFFLQQFKQWELNFPAVAEDGYRAIIRKQHEQSPELAEEALLRWVASSSRQRTISSEKVRRTFSGMDFTPTAELQEFLTYLEQDDAGAKADEETREKAQAEADRFSIRGQVEAYLGDRREFSRYPWWTGTVERRHALGLAALAEGDAAVAGPGPKRAQRRLIIGLNLAPPMEEYVFGSLKGHPFVPLDLITELTWLQFRHPELDPGEEKFNLFIELLFRGKAEAYRSRDLAAIQRHHTVLGQIFAAKGTWRNEFGPGAYNAIFQLSNAIKVAQQRQESEGILQPLPGLKALLVEGYKITGKDEEAAKTALSAAQDYLDFDRLDLATEMLARAVPVLLGATEKIQAAAMQVIVGDRRLVDEGAAADLLRPTPVWALGTGTTNLPDDFLLRQEFKYRTDLANRLVGSNPSVVTQNARAALAAAGQISSMVGVADAQRLERVVGLAPGPNFDITSGAIDLIEAGAGYSTPAFAWRISLPSAETPVFAQLTGPGAGVPIVGDSGFGAASSWVVPFSYDSAELAPATRGWLPVVGSLLSREGGIREIVVTGHSDSKGSAAYNAALSQRRAISVVEFLEAMGVASENMVLESKGEGSPLVPTDDETKEPANRVVKVRVNKYVFIRKCQSKMASAA